MYLNLEIKVCKYSFLEGEVCVCAHVCARTFKKTFVFPGMLIKIFGTVVCVGERTRLCICLHVQRSVCQADQQMLC